MLGSATTKELAATYAEPEIDAARLRALVRENHAFVWRSLRRLGVPEADVDDAAQRVLSVLARRLADVDVGAERSFLFQTALRIASDVRRSRARARVVSDERALELACDHGPGPDDAVHRREARALLDQV